MKEPKIQTLHPEIGKQNKTISLEKYETIRSAILEILQTDSLTHTELMEALHARIHTYFTGNAQWYGETVKLDLEARKLIKRSTTKPPVYSLYA
ncbi:DUF6958 family protein [Mucilaginibacter xinganensis]|uniref:Uncharacterized protein n=1 Tax=Mucilaginibacter xinganensis TaxID=1234841 RepID=A0A223P082_9SPHI|nr:hypothetical protein [Mucilaginibacter xinganensis]ASU35522.1 hypothetical protein MuYL_3637 [Mucilaginibacter xinganensis]